MTSTYDMGIVSKTKDATYEVVDNKDGALISSGAVQASITADKLTGTMTQEVTKVHDEAGVVSQEREVVAQVQEDGIVATVATSEYMVNDAEGIIATGNVVLQKTADQLTGHEVQDVQMVQDYEGTVTQLSATRETTTDALGIMDTVETKSYMVDDANAILNEGVATTRTVEDTFTGQKALTHDEVHVDQDGIVTTVAADKSLVATESGFMAVTDMQTTTADQYGVISDEKVTADTVGDALGETTVVTTLKEG